VGLVYDPMGLPGVTPDRPRVTGVLQVVSVPTLTVSQGAYESIEKDTVAYGSGTWVRMHDVWVLWEGHGMVCMPILDI
jgi:hypothetical protein